jgi:NAD(P)-dependent dehydrogenase (short-subunit alcohol dehydrogenase family)
MDLHSSAGTRPRLSVDDKAHEALIHVILVVTVDERRAWRANAVAPGLVRTPMTERWLNDPQMRDKVVGGLAHRARGGAPGYCRPSAFSGVPPGKHHYRRRLPYGCRTYRPLIRGGNQMDKIHDVAVLVGSLRKDSTNRKMANALADVALAGCSAAAMWSCRCCATRS